MKIITFKDLVALYKDRHNKRGYYDFIKTLQCVLVGVIALILFLTGAFENFELTTFDYRMKMRRTRERNEKIVFVDMGEDSIKKIGRWPWPREWHATMISILSFFGADAVVFDVIFSEPSEESSDAALEEAMKKGGNVYIPYAMELEKYNEERGGWDVRNIILPLERFSRHAKGLGHITIVPDIDGSIRRIPLIIDYENKIYPQLGFRVATALMGLKAEEYEIRENPFGRYVKIGSHKTEHIYIPVDDKNQMIVNWAARWGRDFKHYSFVDVVTSYQARMQNKEPIIDLNEFKDKVCLIGLTAAGLYDIKPNPLQPTYPAVGTNANVINNVLNEEFIKKAPRWLDGLIIILLALLLSANVSKVKPIRGAYLMALMILTYILVAYILLDAFNIWITVIYPLMTTGLGYLVITFYNQIVISIERAKLYMLATKDGLTGLFVIRHFKLLLEAEMNRAKQRGSRLSILMSDIDHFKKINDTYGHQVGDFILKGVASILISCCRELDIPSRYGGEEFIVMLPGAEANDAALVAERIRKRIEEHTFKMGDNAYKATISLGVAQFANEAIIDDFIKRADEALYQSKEGGRNKVTISQPVENKEVKQS